MTIDRFSPMERAARFWPMEQQAKDASGEGPIALLRVALAVGWRHKMQLLVCMLIGVSVATLYARSLPRIYVATAMVLLEPRQFSGISNNLQQSLDLNSAESELQIIVSERLLAVVFESLDLADDPELGLQAANPVRVYLQQTFSELSASLAGLWSSPEEAASVTVETGPRSAMALDSEEGLRRLAFANFSDRVSARRVGQSYVVQIEYSSSDPELPAKVANAIVSAYILQSVAAKEQFARAGTETLQGRLDALAAQVDAAKSAVSSGTLPMAPTPDADAKITGAALPPLHPSSPRTSLIVALGGMLGLFAGMTVLAIRNGFDRRIRGPSDLLKVSNIPCIAAIPDTGSKIHMAASMDYASNHGYAVAIRDLRTSIDIACTSAKNGKHCVIALVGSSHDLGVSMLATSLGHMLSRGGRAVTLFQSGTSREANGHALLSLADVAMSGGAIDRLTFETRDGMLVLPIQSRDPRANTFADYKHARIASIIDAARLRGDVILDLPPVNVSMDALSLMSHADVVLLVTRAGRTTFEQVRDAEQQLRRANANLIGVVINKVKS
jgi:uncharacterized protein involved in exopolysaccharide biosynthesis